MPLPSYAHGASAVPLPPAPRRLELCLRTIADASLASPRESHGRACLDHEVVSGVRLWEVAREGGKWPRTTWWRT